MAAVTTKRKATTGKETISTERIAARAYELFLQRGATSGDDLHDWLAAESELLATASVAPKRRATRTVAAMTATVPNASKKVTKEVAKKVSPKKTASATTTARQKTKTNSAKDKTTKDKKK